MNFMDIIKEANILSQEDITILENINLNKKYHYTKRFSCKGFTLFHHLVLLLNEGEYIEYEILIKKYLKAYPEEINKVNERGYSALHLIACNYTEFSYNLAKILLENNANVNLRCIFGCSILMNLGIIGDINFMRLLLENNINVNVKNSYDNTAIQFVDNPLMIELLLQYDSGPSYGEERRVGDHFTEEQDKLIGKGIDKIRLLNIKN